MSSANLAVVTNRVALTKTPQRRSDKRVATDIAVRWRAAGDASWQIGLVEDASLGGLRLGLAASATPCLGDRIELGVPLVGEATARVAWAGEEALGLAFESLTREVRDRLIGLLLRSASA